MQDLHLVTRRHFFRSAALAAGAPFAAAIASNPVLAAAANPDRTLRVADVLSMTPVDMARESRVVSAARTWLEGCAKRLNDAKLRQTVLDVMADPVPTVAVGLDEAACLETLRTEGLIDKSRTTLLPPLPGDKRSAPQPYWSAPGSGYSSHHAYPGGLVTHCALNAASAEKLLENYEAVFGLKLDRDAAVARRRRDPSRSAARQYGRAPRALHRRIDEARRGTPYLRRTSLCARTPGYARR